MSSIEANQLASEILGEDEVVILYKEGAKLQLVPLPGVPARELDPSLVAAMAEILTVAQEHPGERLSAGETEVLAGYPAASREEVAQSLVRTAGLREQILGASLTGAEAAKRLGVGPSRIRQRIGDRTLYAVKSSRAWRLPAWQFTRRGEVPGMAAVMHALPDDTGLIEVDGFVNSPSVDLVVDGSPVTPLEWLASGRDPQPVVQLAADL